MEDRSVHRPRPTSSGPLSGLESLAAAAEEAEKMSPGTAADSRNPTAWIHDIPAKEQDNNEDAAANRTFAKGSQGEGSVDAGISANQGRKLNPANALGSVYTGGKIKHLKKEDGVPLWRKDIQFRFLKEVFEDTKAVFTSFEDDSRRHNFADIYIRAMAQSSKCSKVLRDKLLGDRESALNMAMICLLVNVGRMNTTLNFFPEMRAQLRTYHAIPCLQAVSETSASGYKGLQDAPRLKSILKGAQEDREQPGTLEKIQSTAVPRTNPVNLIFVLSQYASKVSEIHFTAPVEFFDLITRPTLSSRSRARAFLWLLWWYLESDFSDEAALKNPFGSGIIDPDDLQGRPIKVPEFEHLSEDQADIENVDTADEQKYGWHMKEVRKRILETDEGFSGQPARQSGQRGQSPRIKDEIGAGASPAPSRGSGASRSPSPFHGALSLAKGRDSHTAGRRPVGRVSLKIRDSRLGHGSSPAPPGSGHPIFSTGHASGGAGVGRGRNRTETSHQRAVMANKQARIAKILHAKLRKEQKQILLRNRNSMTTRTGLALSRIMQLPDDYDSEDETSEGPGGLVPILSIDEIEDYGAEATRSKKVVNRACRRANRDVYSNKGLANGLNGFSNRSRKGLFENGDDDAVSQMTMEDDIASNFGSTKRRKGARGRSNVGRSPLSQRHVPPLDSDRLDTDLLVDDEEVLDSDTSGMYDEETEI